MGAIKTRESQQSKDGNFWKIGRSNAIMAAMLDSYVLKVVVTLVAAACSVVGIAGGYYSTYLLVTFLGT